MLKVMETKSFTAPAAVPPELEQADGILTIRRKAGCDPVHAAHTFTYELKPSTEALAVCVEASVGDLTAEKAGVIFSFLDRSGKPTERGYLSRKADTFQGELRRPSDSAFLRLELFSRWTCETVRFQTPTVRETAAEPERKARIIAAKLNPSGGNNSLLLSELEDQLLRAGEKPDMILLPEHHNTRALPPAENPGEPIDGPYARSLAEMALKFHSYVCTTFSLRDERNLLRNAAVIFDRQGKLAGTYYKVHLTMSEAEKGVVPGESFKVFDLDFGRVGILTCWDNWFSESSRIVAGMGAELILFPLAGDGDERHWRNTWPARALDSGVTLAVSIAQGEAKEPVPAAVILPDGSWAATSAENPGYAAATVVLNRKYQTFWLSVGPCRGEGRNLYFAERRPSVYMKNLEGREE